MRASVIAAVVAVASGIALFLPWPLPSTTATMLISVLISAHIGASCWAASGFGHALRDRHPQHRRRITALMFLGGSGVCAATAIVTFGFDAGVREHGVPWTFPLGVVSGAIACAAVFAGTGAAINALTRRATSVRVRAAAFTFACGAIVLIFYRSLQGMMPSQGLFWLALPLCIAAFFSYGLSGAFSHSLTEPLEHAVSALRRVEGGDLAVTLDASGRDEIAELARTFNQMMQGLRERAFLERAFGQYVAGSVLETLKKQNALEISAERREASVLFADIRGFTAFSESTTPEDVLRVLNVYLDRIVEVVSRHGGYLNKFIGDAVMVVFNAPVDQPEHAALVVRCAREMQAEVASLNAARAFGADREVRVGIGVNSGPLVAGTLGSDRRAEYTVIGDTVNTASRLCSSAKAGEILVGARTAALLGSSADAATLEPMPPLSVKGKAQPLEVFRVTARTERAASVA